MAADEAFSFHERLNVPIREALGGGNLGTDRSRKVDRGSHHERDHRLGGEVRQEPQQERRENEHKGDTRDNPRVVEGVELIGGRFAELYGPHNLTYSMIVTVEESLEMAGVILFLWALLVYMTEHYGEVHFQFQGAGEAASRSKAP